jgi:ribosome-associated protein
LFYNFVITSKEDIMANKAFKILDVIAQTIYDKKGANILALDVRGISSMTDFYIIAEGNVDRHLNGISKAVQDALILVEEKPLHIEGIGSDWIVVDYGDVIVHLLIPDAREKYALEQLWQSAKIVDLHIEVKKT